MTRLDHTGRLELQHLRETCDVSNITIRESIRYNQSSSRGCYLVLITCFASMRLIMMILTFGHHILVLLSLIYLQIWHPFLKGLWVLFEQPLLLEELCIVAICGGLEQTIVQDIPQRFSQGAQHLLFGLPHSGIRVKSQTFLQKQQKQSGYSFGNDMQLFCLESPICCLEVNILTPAQYLISPVGGGNTRARGRYLVSTQEINGRPVLLFPVGS